MGKEEAKKRNQRRNEDETKVGIDNLQKKKMRARRSDCTLQNRGSKVVLYRELVDKCIDKMDKRSQRDARYIAWSFISLTYEISD